MTIEFRQKGRDVSISVDKETIVCKLVSLAPIAVAWVCSSVATDHVCRERC